LHFRGAILVFLIEKVVDSGGDTVFQTEGGSIAVGFYRNMIHSCATTHNTSSHSPHLQNKAQHKTFRFL